MTDVVACPCQTFCTVEDVRRALDSDEQTQKLVTWLSSMDDANNRLRILSCQVASKNPSQYHGPCNRRILLSVSILNEIRDACRYHLGGVSTTSTSAMSDITKSAAFMNLESNNLRTNNTETKKLTPTETYNDAFPSLCSTSTQSSSVSSNSNATLLVGRKKSKRPKDENVVDNNIAQLARPRNVNSLSSQQVRKKSNKPKRQIRPVLSTSAATVVPETAWGQPVPSSSGNISNLPSETPLEPIPKPIQSKIIPIPETNNEQKILLVTPQKVAKNRNDYSENTHNNNEKTTQIKLSFTDTELVGDEKLPNKNVSTPPKNTMPQIDQELERLVKVYSTILLYHLVPSTALELHLLVRLMTVPQESSYFLDENVIFSSIFSTGLKCRSFAKGVMYRIEGLLRNIGYDLVKAIVECPPVQKLLPDLTNDLRSTLNQNALVRIGNPSSSVGSNQTPMLTLPFVHERDSRHNYRGREALYKNREESRDAFLHQFQTFQKIRGRGVLDVIQAERSIQKIRVASKDVIQGILPTNMLWFANMFCELLLQIGHVPIEETDKDLLNITNKDKLQKLHRRFSCKEGGKSSKSSHKLVLDPKSQSDVSSSASAQAQQWFSGHQEFFFIFIQSADSYSFGMQLKNRIVGMITELRCAFDRKGFEQRLLDLQLLSKFLGLLVFSPNWQDAGSGGASSLQGSEDAITDIDSTQPVLPLKEYVEDAWKRGRLVAVIPWVVHFLRAIRWDNLSQRSLYYRDLFALLKAIHQQEKIVNNKEVVRVPSDERTSQANMQFISYHLETIFSDVVGLAQMSSLPSVNLPKQDAYDDSSVAGDTIPLDATPFLYERSLLISSNPYVEDLFALLNSLKNSRGKSSVNLGASPRKVRPTEIAKLAQDSFTTLATKNNITTPTTALVDQSTQGKDAKASVQRKLVDAFFHQHQDLKEICDFAVDRSLKNATSSIQKQFIIPTFENGLSSLELSENETTMSSETFIDTFMECKADSLEKSRTFLRSYLEKTITESVKSLSSPTLHKMVIEVAISLAISHGVRLGESMIDTLIRTESEKARDAFEKKERKRKLHGLTSSKEKIPPPTAKKSEETLLAMSNTTVINSLNSLAETLMKKEAQEEDFPYTAILQATRNARENFSAIYCNSEANDNESHSLRTDLDFCGPCFAHTLEVCLLKSPYLDDESIIVLVYELLCLTIDLEKAHVSHRVVKNVTKAFRGHANDDKLSLLKKLIEVGVIEAASKKDIGVTLADFRKLLNDMRKINIIDMSQLKEACLCICPKNTHEDGVTTLLEEVSALLME